MTRSREDVDAEILETRAALEAADQASAEQADDPEAWALGDIFFDRLIELSREAALLPHTPHPRLPHTGDGHTTPRAY